MNSQACFEPLVYERVAAQRRGTNRLEEVRVDRPLEEAAVRRVARSRIVLQIVIEGVYSGAREPDLAISELRVISQPAH